MSSEIEKFSLEGKIVKMVTSEYIKVELVNKKIIDCHLAKKLRRYSSYLLEGDLVIVELDLYDLNKGKIIERIMPEKKV
ncbi:translation initiation factor IF-1 [Candidatus Mycoplasma haematominutum]|uniref:Translation initiation factor IF-1 n=1 Tax=Candidatus Mycoplasma haematominutum 'Birmingham 1' TaxID=1116213 RepID=G8C337_9MOLU|nr:translation initiation factor IF-1 [Candidatus Mycoplasma haematominutum]CCE66735.1 translation initiation factor IF-1 [Candidatus Mycoplasma haematominutum 'Birmingham 1']